MQPKDAFRILVEMVVHSNPDNGADLIKSVAPTDVATLADVARAHGVEAWLAAVAPSGDPAWQPVAEQRVRFSAARARSAAVLSDLGATLRDLDCEWAR